MANGVTFRRDEQSGDMDEHNAELALERLGQQADQVTQKAIQARSGVLILADSPRILNVSFGSDLLPDQRDAVLTFARSAVSRVGIPIDEPGGSNIIGMDHGIIIRGFTAGVDDLQVASVKTSLDYGSRTQGVRLQFRDRTVPAENSARKIVGGFDSPALGSRYDIEVVTTDQEYPHDEYEPMRAIAGIRQLFEKVLAHEIIFTLRGTEFTAEHGLTTPGHTAEPQLAGFLPRSLVRQFAGRLSARNALLGMEEEAAKHFTLQLYNRPKTAMSPGAEVSLEDVRVSNVMPVLPQKQPFNCKIKPTK